MATKEKRDNIYRSLIATNGLLIQQMVAIEELGELQKEIIKDVRGEANVEHIAEEIADVEIMIEQIKLHYNLDQRVEEYKDHKIMRITTNYPITMGR